MTRRFGRAPRGERVIGAVPQNYGANLTMIAALSLHGIEAVMTIEGATDAEVFQVYTEQVLGPTLHPGDIVVLDNLSAHKLAPIRGPSRGAGPSSSTCRRTRRISHPSSKPGRRSKPSCVPPKPAPARHWRWLSDKYCRPLPQGTPMAGSHIAAIPYLNL
jgi:hypothetical protein